MHTISFAPGAVARLFQSLKKEAREEEPQLREKINVEARKRRQGARRRRVSTNSLFNNHDTVTTSCSYTIFPFACSYTSVEVSL